MASTRPVAKPWHFVAGIVMLLVVNGLCAMAEGEEPFRTWTSGRHSVEARAKWVSDDDGVPMVGLERKDNGRLVEARVQRLSAEDRAYLARYVARLRQEARENAATSTKSKPKIIDRTQAIANISAAIEKAADQDERRQLENIRRNLKNGSNGLSIFRLTKIPPEVWSMTHLTELLITDCQLTELPPGIGNLTNLTKLTLRNNQLTTLPPEIAKLKKLELLDLSANKITKLPPEIGELSNLKYLFVGYSELKKELAINQLTELPPEIGKLQKLETFYLVNNRLAALPPEITKLTNLKVLNLADNPITDESVRHLKLLTGAVEINLERTKVTKAGRSEIRKAITRSRNTGRN